MRPFICRTNCHSSHPYPQPTILPPRPTVLPISQPLRIQAHPRRSWTGSSPRSRAQRRTLSSFPTGSSSTSSSDTRASRYMPLSFSTTSASSQCPCATSTSARWRAASPRSRTTSRRSSATRRRARRSQRRWASRRLELRSRRASTLFPSPGFRVVCSRSHSVDRLDTAAYEEALDDFGPDDFM